MNKTAFLDELKKYLKKLSPDEVQDILDYYNEYFDESESDAIAIQKLQSPKQLAGKLIAEAQVNELSGPTKSKNRISLMTVIFAVLSAPVTIPFSIFFIVFAILGLVIGALGCFSIVLFCFSFIISCLFTGMAIIPAFGSSIPTGLYVFGIFLMQLAFSISFFFLAKYTIKQSYYGSKKFISKIALRRYATCNEKR